MPETKAEMPTHDIPVEKDETAEDRSILEVYVLTPTDNEMDDSAEKESDAEVDNNSEMNKEEINSESELAEMEDLDDDDITEVDTITTMINNTVMKSEVEANSEPEFEEKDANIKNDVDATAKMDSNADMDNTQQRPKIPSYASFTVDGTVTINGTTVMKNFVPVEGIPKTAQTRGSNGPMAMICLSAKDVVKGKKGTKSQRLVDFETQLNAGEIGTEKSISEEEMINVLAKLQKKYKKPLKHTCPVCNNRGYIKCQTTLKMGVVERKYIMHSFLLDMVNGDESVPTFPTKYLN